MAQRKGVRIMAKKMIIPVVLAVLTASAIEVSSRIYPQTMIVDNIDYESDIVTIATGTGLLYQYDGAEDADVGDLEAVIMFDAGKKGIVTDDMILKVRYAGYTELFEGITE